MSAAGEKVIRVVAVVGVGLMGGSLGLALQRRAGVRVGRGAGPDPGARRALFERLHRLVSALGARPVAIDPDVHDRLMALVSHLPHAIAAALIHQAADTAPAGREALRSAGPSFTDLTRVAGANPPLWADILLDNREALVAALDEQSARLGEVRRALVGGDRAWLRSFMEGAAA